MSNLKTIVIGCTKSREAAFNDSGIAAKIAARNANLTIFGSDWRYSFEGAPYEDGEPSENYLIGRLDENATVEHFEDATQQILDVDRLGPMKYTGELVFIAGDNDIWNDWDNVLASFSTSGKFGINFANQENMNTYLANFTTNYKNLSSGSYDGGLGYVGQPLTNVIDIFDNDDVVNLGSGDEPVKATIPPWVSNTAVKLSDGTAAPNGDYSFPLPTFDDAFAEAHFGTPFRRFGYKFDGARDDINPDVEYFVLSTAAMRDPVRSEHDIGTAEGVSNRMSPYAKAWLTKYALESTATFVEIQFDSIPFPPKYVFNQDGMQFYDDIWDTLNPILLGRTGVSFTGVDKHVPYITSLPKGGVDSNDNVFANGCAQINCSPFFNSYSSTSIGGLQPEIVWTPNPDGDEVSQVYAETVYTAEEKSTTFYSTVTNEPQIIARQKPDSNSFWVIETAEEALTRLKGQNMDTTLDTIKFISGASGSGNFGVSPSAGYGSWVGDATLDGQDFNNFVILTFGTLNFVVSGTVPGTKLVDADYFDYLEIWNTGGAPEKVTTVTNAELEITEIGGNMRFREKVSSGITLTETDEFTVYFYKYAPPPILTTPHSTVKDIAFVSIDVSIKGTIN